MPDVSLLDRIRIASPCTASWASMRGDDRVRFCEDCKLNVYNLSAMTQPQAEELIREKEGRLCATLYRRRDGTVITRDCPVALARTRATFARGVTLTGSAITAMVGFAMVLIGRADASIRLRQLQPFRRIATWLSPTPPTRGFQFMGSISLPPPAGLVSLPQPIGPGGADPNPDADCAPTRSTVVIEFVTPTQTVPLPRD